MPTLRVLHVIDGLGHGGAERLLADLAHGAPLAGLEIGVAALYRKDGQPAAAALALAGVHASDVGALGLLDPRSLLRVRAAIAEAAPDLVHTHLAYADLLGSVAAASLRIPVVSTLHVTNWDHATSRRERLKAGLAAAARRRLVDRVVAVSEAARRAYSSGRPGRQLPISVVHNGILGRAIPGAGPAVRRELGISADAPVLATLSVLRPDKGHDRLIEAMRMLRTSRPDATLLIIGDGPSRPHLEQRASDLGSAVVFAGHRTDVMRVLDAADLLVHLPTHDALPTSLLEAMAAGLPVIATAVGGIPEIITDGVDGVLLPADAPAGTVATAVVSLLDQPEHRASLATAARNRFDTYFQAHLWALRLRRLYDEVLLRDASRPA